MRAVSFLLLLLTINIRSSIALADWTNTSVDSLPDSIRADTTLYEFVEIDQRPIPVHVPDESYEALAKQLGLSGRVVIRALVGTDGRVERTKVARGASALLDSIASTAMRNAVFKPALNNNRPVALWFTHPMTFELDEAESVRVAAGPRPTLIPLDTPEPQYPTSIRSGARGKVVVWASVPSHGEVRDIVVATSTDPAFTDAALNAIRRWRYEPYRRDYPRTPWVYIPVTFSPP